MTSSSKMWGLSCNKYYKQNFPFHKLSNLEKKYPKSDYLKSIIKIDTLKDCCLCLKHLKVNYQTPPPKKISKWLSSEVMKFQLLSAAQPENGDLDIKLLLVRVKTFRMVGSLPDPELNILQPDQTAGQPTSHQIKHILFVMNSLEPKNLILLQRNARGMLFTRLKLFYVLLAPFLL